jgi:ADP-heptose:LPS heptosyltransferase
VALDKPRLLILRALKLGDLLTAVPALRALARAFPDHERVLAAPGSLGPLVALIDLPAGESAIHRVADTGELQPLASELHGCQWAVNLHGRGPQSHRILLAAEPDRAIWFEHPEVPESAGAPRWRADEHEVERWCRLLTECGISANPDDVYLPAPASAPPASGATVIHPGASSPARRWPLDRFAAVARAERGRGRPVLITGSRAELALAEELAARANLPPGAVLAGRTDLVALAATIAAAQRVVCGDTGVAHLASALRVPSVVLFGPTSPSHWGPRGDGATHRFLWGGRSGDPHGSEPDQGLLEIDAEQVIAALGEFG